MDVVNIDLAINLIKSLLPLKINKILCNYGSFILIELGNQLLEANKRTLSIYYAYWEVKKNDRVLLNANFRSREKCHRILDNFQNSSIINFKYDMEKEIITFVIDNNFSLNLQADNYYDIEDDLFDLKINENKALCYSKKLKFYCVDHRVE